MEISKGDLVESLAGHDRGDWFFVVDCDGTYAAVADGKCRKLFHPKRKKLKHVRLIARTDCLSAQRLRTGGEVLDSELRRDLARLRHQNQSHNQGG
ncbi:KOW domain-containing RNA-binding protein [Candidatus Avoscillospira sp. LCP25S3_F1]|uniref:KOW domain-containing RNA-binding protein n=1 Tax=Candidatus Avoscillospira sp. LCP25S3_F1 TaxID=3438825 RepID=UPI003F8E2861